MKSRLVAATLALGLAAPSVARADTPASPAAPATPATEQARAHYKQGKAYQDVGSYDQAIAEYLEADRLAPRPELFFNIAQCHRLAGHTALAVKYYHRFVDAMPDAAGADDARRYIAELERKLKDEQAQKDEEARRAAAADPHPPLTSSEADEGHAGRPALRWVGIGSVVTGAALVGVGAYFGSRASDEGDALSGMHGEWTPELAAREAEGKSDEQRMWILVGAGSLLVVGGAALWWWGGKHGHVEAVPVATHESAGLVVRGSFE
jgi:tetratricopeptide (TPR) repeat protein